MGFVKVVLREFFSVELMLILLVVLAAAVGFATFIEKDFGSETAWALVYGARWFEILWFLLILNLVGNIIKYKMWLPKKLPAFVFHLSFLIIFIGALLTRYGGFEGVIHLRENSENNKIVSSDAFLQIIAQSGDTTFTKEKKIYLSSIWKFINSFTEEIEIEGKKLTVRYLDYYPVVEKKIVPGEKGQPIISATFFINNQPVEKILRYGESVEINDFILSFGKPVKKNEKTYVSITVEGGNFFLSSNETIKFINMNTNQPEKIEKKKKVLVKEGKLYTVKGHRFIVNQGVLSGKVNIIPVPQGFAKLGKNKGMLVVEVSYDGKKEVVNLLGGGKGANIIGEPVTLNIKEVKITLLWGAKTIELPFSLYLRDFIIERYPGSMKPSYYKSIVIIKDPIENKEFEYQIYMNRILDYGGYRFFQSSYDSDEKGTVLSVNYDPGKMPTYIGYTLLIVGLFINIINPHSRFRKLAKMKINRLVGVFLLLFALFYPSIGEENPLKMPLEKILMEVKKVSKEHGEKFGTLLTQGIDGRIKPIDTLSIEILNKVSKRTSFYGLNHNQIVLGMLVRPEYWQAIPLIKVSHPTIKKILGISLEERYFSFNKAFDENGYKLSYAVEQASKKDPSQRNQFDKEIIKIDERINVLYMVFTGELFRIFPLKGDPDHRWYSPQSAMEKFPEEESQKVRLLIIGYLAALEKGIREGNWSIADKFIKSIKEYQKTNGADLYLSQTKINAEILYNRLNIFERLIFVYLFTGSVLLVLVFIRLFKPSLDLSIPIKTSIAILIIGFLLHTFNLGFRWYISGYAPWSNGYESLIYIGWAVVLAGIFFTKKSTFAVATAGILGGLILFIAHLSWMDPQITTLVPILKSHWLAIHVSVITASYGFLGLSALLGFIALILFIIKNPALSKEKQKNIIGSILQATRVNEMSMIIGLSLLTVGNLLGGVWANESWGRYWGWDPKESWTLVTILIYVFILHIRIVPWLNSTYLFNVLSVAGFFSVLMTYFGVNYYLSGLHSYGAGDPPSMPVWVYGIMIMLLVVIAAAYRNRKIERV